MIIFILFQVLNYGVQFFKITVLDIFTSTNIIRKMAVTQVTFGVWDYVVIAVVLLISASIGVYYRFTGGKQKTVQVSKCFD